MRGTRKGPSTGRAQERAATAMARLCPARSLCPSVTQRTERGFHPARSPRLLATQRTERSLHLYRAKPPCLSPTQRTERGRHRETLPCHSETQHTGRCPSLLRARPPADPVTQQEQGKGTLDRAGQNCGHRCVIQKHREPTPDLWQTDRADQSREGGATRSPQPRAGPAGEDRLSVL